MTRREHIERKLEKRREWAEGRRDKASALRNATPDSLRHDWAFITQPGHIPERARMNARDDRAYEHDKMATHHEQKAEGLKHQLNNTIFTDDPDAIEALEAKIAKLQAKQDYMKQANRLMRKNDRTGLAAMGMTEPQIDRLFEPDFCGRPGFPDYALQNNNANIRRLKNRIEEVRDRQKLTAKVEATESGVLIEEFSSGPYTYTRVTFAEKPERAILNDLKAAGFRWSGGYWFGEAANLPQSVKTESEATR